MKLKLLISTFTLAIACILALPVAAQDNAVTSAPMVKSMDGNVVFSIRVSSFVPGKNYRLGFGAAGDTAPVGTLKLTQDGKDVAAEALDFKQGYTSNWWGVEQVASKGFQLKAADLPPAGTELLFEVSLPQEAADQFNKLFIFVARDYGSNTWYLEDGSVLEDTYW
ncbi:MAG: hypothetical protein JSU96_05605 [Acidobacteriota bacterium]|nr:MAG: hypothetical protein JSU96_05605 [Acidobacteriota bacterium]